MLQCVVMRLAVDAGTLRDLVEGNGELAAGAIPAALCTSAVLSSLLATALTAATPAALQETQLTDALEAVEAAPPCVR